MSAPPLSASSSTFEQIIVATWYYIDVGDPSNVQQYFTADAKLYASRGEPIVGRHKIRDGYVARRARNPNRTSRHVISNVFVASTAADAIQTVSCMRLYAGEGTPPFPSPEPLSVADQFDTFVRGVDGEWLIAERRLHLLFANPEAVFHGPVVVN